MRASAPILASLASPICALRCAALEIRTGHRDRTASRFVFEPPAIA
jgi:hypothetical protein